MKNFNILIAVLVIFIFGGLFFFKNGFTKAASNNQPSATAALFDMEKYVSYSESNLAAAQSRGKTVLFFAATTWCQSCSALEDEIIERLSEVPEEVTILKVDYDNDKAMNRLHAVTTQHTQVLLDQEGQEIKRWVGGGFDTLLVEVEGI